MSLTLPTCYLKTGAKLIHNCEEVMEQVYSSRPDLKICPIENAELEWFIDRSSFEKEGKGKAVYARGFHHRVPN